MSVYHNPPTVSRRFQLVLSSFLQKEGLSFAEALPEQRINEIFAEMKLLLFRHDTQLSGRSLIYLIL